MTEEERAAHKAKVEARKVEAREKKQLEAQRRKEEVRLAQHDACRQCFPPGTVYFGGPSLQTARTRATSPLVS